MPQTILIRTPNHLGDCVMALSMIKNTGEAYPGSQITLLTPRHLSDLFKHNAEIDNVIEIPPEHVHGMLSIVKIRDLISPFDFNIGYILPPSFGAAASFKLGGVKERIGYVADGRRLLLTRPIVLPTPLTDSHRSVLYFDLLRRAADVDLDYTNPKLFINDDDLRDGLALLNSFGVSADDHFVCIAFRAVAESRRWGTDKYRELTKQLIADYGFKVILIGSADDQKEGQDLAEATSTKNVVNLAGKTSLREVAAILSRAKLFIGNDSGPAHLAAAVGAPIIVLSGADNPSSTSPQTVRKSLIYLAELECISCVKNKCPLKGENHMQCMTGISVEMVMERVAELMGTFLR